MRLRIYLILLILVCYSVDANKVAGQSLANDNIANIPDSLNQGSNWFSQISFQADQLLRRSSSIPVSVGALWMTDAQTGLTVVDTSLKFPILKLFGSPPPIVKAGFSYTDLYPAIELGLPEDLFEYSIGVSGVRQFSERWTLRMLLGVGFATDNLNTSSDAWQFRGGAFGIYQANEQWRWSIGAIALGRDDLPVVPALGAIWTPSPYSRWDLILPNPRINFLMADNGIFQKWLYVGGGFNGTTWGYESDRFGDDRLTYSDLRVVMGWQSSPKAPPGVAYAKGRKSNVEIGYAFSRDFEFNNEQIGVPLDDAVLLRVRTDY